MTAANNKTYTTDLGWIVIGGLVLLAAVALPLPHAVGISGTTIGFVCVAAGLLHYARRKRESAAPPTRPTPDMLMRQGLATTVGGVIIVGISWLVAYALGQDDKSGLGALVFATPIQLVGIGVVLYGLMTLVRAGMTKSRRG